MEADAIGIRSAEGEVLVRRASCSATGMKIASAPTFLVAIDSSITNPASTGTCTCTVRRRGVIGRIADSTMPDLAMAALTTRAAAMMMTTSSEKPSKALRAGTTPIATPTTRAAMATRSYGSRPQTKQATVQAISAKESPWSTVIGSTGPGPSLVPAIPWAGLPSREGDRWRSGSCTPVDVLDKQCRLSYLTGRPSAGDQS